jgi:RNA 2',3'-cyclic 3'-phosphodiesterase
MRLFAAIELDEAARVKVADEQRRIQRGLGERAGPKWTSGDQLHITLVFLGQIEEANAPAIADAVRTPIPVAPFALTFAGVGVFPARGAPRVVWLGTTTGSAEAASVQRLVGERVRRLGVELESRPFRPHVTLARWRGAVPGDRRRLLAANTGRAVATIDVDHVTLFHSKPLPGGSQYTPLAVGPLIAGEGPPVQ